MRRKEKEKITLSELREDAILSAALPQFRVMGFRPDSSISRLSAELVAIIEYAIGDKLKDLNEKISDRTNSIRLPIIAEIDLEAISEMDRNSLFLKVKKALSQDHELVAWAKEEAALWQQEVNKEDIDVIEIDDKEYHEKFPEEKKKINLLYGEYSVDGYQALLSLVSKNYITIK